MECSLYIHQYSLSSLYEIISDASSTEFKMFEMKNDSTYTCQL